MSKKSKQSISIDPNLNLAQLSVRYIDHMRADGKSDGTCHSYLMELKSAIAELGADTIVSEITPKLIESFNQSDRVMKLKSGRAKAAPSYLKTQRVLRLALAFAEQTGLIAKSPIAAKLQKEDAPAPEPTPAPKKSRKSRVVVEVANEQPQEVAETPAA